MAQRKAQFFRQIEDSPDADPQAVFAPSKITRVRRRTQSGWSMTQTAAEGEMLHIQRHIEGEPLSVWPVELRTGGNGRVIVPIMMVYAHRVEAIPTAPRGPRTRVQSGSPAMPVGGRSKVRPIPQRGKGYIRSPDHGRREARPRRSVQ